jgi:hypothetical protein
MKNHARGISIPIAFKYNYRGKKYREIDVYFSYHPISSDQRDLLELGTSHSKDLPGLIKKAYGAFDALVPYKVVQIPKYESAYGMWIGIELIDENPTMVVMHDAIGLMPCTSNNLETLLGVFKPDFYLGVRDGKVNLNIKHGGSYCEIPSQPYSHRCWQGFGHSMTVIDGAPIPAAYAALNWSKLLSDLVRVKD